MSQEKKGGPYTKKQQDERRKKVHELFFEKQFSAVPITAILEVNRNAINNDIKLIYSQMDDSLPVHSSYLLLNKIQGFEKQCVRFEPYLKHEKDFSKKIILEKNIFQINNTITKFYEKMSFVHYNFLYTFKKPE